MIDRIVEKAFEGPDLERDPRTLARGHRGNPGQCDASDAGGRLDGVRWQAGASQRASRLHDRRDAVPAAHASGCELVATTVSREEILDWLSKVADPEIPVLSITDLGIVRNVEIGDDVTVSPRADLLGLPRDRSHRAERRRRIACPGHRGCKNQASYVASLDHRLDQRRGPREVARIRHRAARTRREQTRVAA